MSREKEMNNELVPEIHDIGKLVDEKFREYNTKEEHYEHCFDEEKIKELNIEIPKGLNWQVIQEHHKDKKDGFFLLLRIADQTASSASRLLHPEGELKEKLNKYLKEHKENYTLGFRRLWKHSNNKKRDSIKESFISSEEEVKNLIKFIKECQNGSEVLKKYEEKLRRHPETVYPLNDTVSLYTHSRLVGKIYRLFEKLIESISSDNPEVKLIRCKIEPSQYLCRTKDLAVFKILQEEINNITDKYDEVLFNTLDELILLTPQQEINSHIFNDLIEKYGALIEVEEAKTKIKDILPTPNLIIRNQHEDQLKGKNDKQINKWIKRNFPGHCLYPFLLEPRIDPRLSPLCEICQLEPAKPIEKLTEKEEKFTIDKETGLRERLGQRCLNIRTKFEKEELLHKLKTWTEEKDINVVWVKVSLDIERLISTLKFLYRNYIDEILSEKNLSKEIKDKIEIRFSLIQEFLEDYNKFLAKIGETFYASCKEENVENIRDDLWVIRIKNLSQIIGLLEIYQGCFMEYFPQLKDNNECAVRINLSSSNAKYPFFKHWQILSNEKNSSVYINLISKGEVRAEMRYLDEIIVRAKCFDYQGKTTLHNLAEVAKLSKTLAKVTFFDEDNRRGLKELLPMGLEFSDILTLAKILSDMEELHQ